MTLFAIFITNDEGATQQLPIAMFRDKDAAAKWFTAVYPERATFKVKEIEITRCDAIERTGLVRG